jgi:hypothetical protein
MYSIRRLIGRAKKERTYLRFQPLIKNWPIDHSLLVLCEDIPVSLKLSVDGDDLTIVKNRIYLT